MIDCIIKLAKTLLMVNVGIFICFYIPCLFILSTIVDLYPIPNSYFSESETVFNNVLMRNSYYNVVVVTVLFVALTSYVYCCGSIHKVLYHVLRVIMFPLGFVHFIHFGLKWLRDSYGMCSVDTKKNYFKQKCLSNGYTWETFNISGHEFYLLCWVLFLLEEASVYKYWDKLGELIIEEEYDRKISIIGGEGPLWELNDTEFLLLKNSYTKLSGFIKISFIMVAAFTLLSFLLLIDTSIYFHQPIEKLIAAFLSVVLWYLIYKKRAIFITPGDGVFQCDQLDAIYIKSKNAKNELQNSKYNMDFINERFLSKQIPFPPPLCDVNV